MAVNGLKADTYRGWIDKSITIDKALNTIYSNYVVGTPAFDCSIKGRDLYSFYGIKTGADYRLLFSELLGTHDITFCEDYDSVKQAIVSDSKKNFTNTFPRDIEEWFCYYTGRPAGGKLYLTIAQDQSVNPNPPTWTADEKRATVNVDMLFRHIRNSFAHGGFTFIEKDEERFYVLQDESCGCISARMIVKQSTLEKWMGILDQKRAQFIKNKS